MLEMLDRRLILAGIWIALMLIYLLGDVLRIFSGDYLKGDMDITQFTQPMFLGISALMVIPIIMILVALLVPYPINRWANIIVAVFFFLFNIVGVPTYVGWYDKFLLAVSLVFNVMTVYYAWTWALEA